MPDPIAENLKRLVRRDPRPDGMIAAAAGIDPGNLSKFLSGKRGLSLAAAGRLAKAVGRPFRVSKPKGNRNAAT